MELTWKPKNRRERKDKQNLIYWIKSVRQAPLKHIKLYPSFLYVSRLYKGLLACFHSFSSLLHVAQLHLCRCYHFILKLRQEKLRTKKDRKLDLSPEWPHSWRAGLVNMDKIELFSKNTIIGIIDIYNKCIGNKYFCFTHQSPVLLRSGFWWIPN